MRNKLLFILFMFCVSGMLSAQHLTRSGGKINMKNYNSQTRGVTAIYSQDFEGDFPANMTIIDVDKNTPNAKVAKYGQSWSKQVISGMNMAAVTSWFTPAGTANDWMITPAIDLTTDNKLVWSAASLDKDYKESYKVWISTTAPNAASFDASKFTLLKDVKKEEASLTTHVIDLKAKGYENTKVWIAFQMVSNDCYVLVLDNILVGKFDGIDCSNVSSLFDQSIKLNKEVVIKGAVRNKLMEPVTSVELTWYVEGSSDKHNQTFSGLNLAYMQAQEFTFTDKYTGTKNGEETIIVEIVKVNNAVDEDNTNNKKSFKIETIETPVPRKVLIEEATGAWCGFCPDGALVLKDIISKNKNVIGVAAHAGDKMEIAETKELCNTLGAGFPSGMINRTQFGGKTGISRNEWKANAEAMIANMPTSVSIELTTSYNASTKEVTADIKTNFTNEKKGDFRINLYIVENKVTGTGTGWDQANYYDDASKFPGHSLNGKGNPIKGYVHNHVIRKMVGGTWGTDGIIPDVAKGEYTHQYKLTLDDGWKPEDIHIVATVSEYGASTFSRKIFNVEEATLVKEEKKSFEIYKDGSKVDLSNPIVINGKSSDNELKYAFKAKNTSSSEVKVKMKREIVSATKEHSFYFCWKDCYQPTVTETSEMTIAAGAEHADELSLHLEPKGTEGTSKYKVILVNSADANDKLEFEVHFAVTKKTTDNIVNADKIGLEQYPNPAKDIVNVNFNINKTLNAEPVINIYNLYGKLVKVVKVNARSGYVTNAINCSDFASGMYTYRIVMGDQSYTGKIIKE